MCARQKLSSSVRHIDFSSSESSENGLSIIGFNFSIISSPPSIIWNFPPNNASKSLNVNPTLSGPTDTSLNHFIVDRGIILFLSAGSYSAKTSWAISPRLTPFNSLSFLKGYHKNIQDKILEELCVIRDDADLVENALLHLSKCDHFYSDLFDTMNETSEIFNFEYWLTLKSPK